MPSPECGTETRLQRLEHRAESTEQRVCPGQGTEWGVKTADYRDSTGAGRPEGVGTGQEHSAYVAYVAQHRLLRRECGAYSTQNSKARMVWIQRLTLLLV